MVDLKTISFSKDLIFGRPQESAPRREKFWDFSCKIIDFYKKIDENPVPNPKKFLDASGAEVAYQGIMAKRSPPDADDYLLVRAGTRAEAPIDLTSKYTLGSGDYTIRFTGNAISGLPASNTVTITVP